MVGPTCPHTVPFHAKMRTCPLESAPAPPAPTAIRSPAALSEMEWPKYTFDVFVSYCRWAPICAQAVPFHSKILTHPALLKGPPTPTGSASGSPMARRLPSELRETLQPCRWLPSSNAAPIRSQAVSFHS